MKHIASLLLIIATLLTLLSGCNAGDYYTVTVTGEHVTLVKPLKSKYNAGETVDIELYKMDDAFTYAYLDGKKLGAREAENGKHWLYSFVMPEHDVTLHLTGDEFYGQDEIDFRSAFFISILDRVDSVSITRTQVGSKDSFVEHIYSTKPEDIAAFKAMTEEKLVKLDDYSVPTPHLKELYTFSSGDYYDDIILRDGHPTKSYDQGPAYIFAFKNEAYTAPTIEDPDLVTYSFADNRNEFTLKKHGDESFSMQYGAFYIPEFVLCDEAPTDITPEYYLDGDYGRINLISPTLFELGGRYYEIVKNAEDWVYNYIQNQ